MAIKWLSEIDIDMLSEKRVLCRVDFNVPMGGQRNILDGQRIERTLPTIKNLIRANAKVVILSHLGRPKGKVKESLSLEPVAQYLRDFLNEEIIFVHDCIGQGVTKVINDAKPGQVIFLENLRFHSGEEKNDPVFTKLLAKNGDFYINDAFGVSHRDHASVAGITKYFDDPIGGMLLKREITTFENLLRRPRKPFVLVVGGSKVSSKLAVLLRMLPKVDTILIGGAMAYTFLAAKGENIGDSLVEKDRIVDAERVIKKAQEFGVRLCLPRDHIVATSSFANVKTVSHIPKGYMGFDIGEETSKEYARLIKEGQTVFLNGPMGMFEKKEFSSGTKEVFKGMASCDGYTVVGGGDSISALNSVGLIKEIDFVSTGGGAGLEYLEGKKMPGLSALGYYK